MRIIKPYGRSQVELDGRGQATRSIRIRVDGEGTAEGTFESIVEFATKHDELVLAQWISAIDKIATKPSLNKAATPEQHRFRQRLGAAAWAHLVDQRLLKGLADSEKGARLARTWNWKIAPYGDKVAEHRGKGSTPSAKGRWFARFAGERETDAADVAAIVGRLHEHLHVAAYRIGSEMKKRKGLIEARADSITRSVASQARPKTPGWSGNDVDIYRRAGDVAAEIHAAARIREKGEDGSGLRQVTNSLAGEILWRHWQRIFPDGNEGGLSVCDAKAKAEGLFHLHMAVKDHYARTLKQKTRTARARMDKPQARKEECPISTVLHSDLDALMALIGSRRDNRDLAALIRLGKIIHYTAGTQGEDSPQAVASRWPVDISRSRFRTSDGQAEIKRNEALVRIWRHVIALAARTLKHWADPSNVMTHKDILSNRATDEATGQKVFSPQHFERKCDLLFGARAAGFSCAGDEAFQKAVLRSAIRGWTELRNKGFHFTGCGGFVAALTGLGQLDVDRFADVLATMRGLWKADIAGRAGRLRATMLGAQFGDYLDEGQNRRIFDAVNDARETDLPLPRFGRVLLRAANIGGSGLPPRANRRELEDPARLCQHTALKLLYDRPFRAWLDGLEGARIGEYAKRALAATAGRAREEFGEDVVARADGLTVTGDGAEAVRRFFFDLSAATATEMRVQNGYASDGEAAREQAGFIENYKCDVIGLAFGDYLAEAGLSLLLGLAGKEKPVEPLFDPANLPDPPADGSPGDWHAVLYFLLHMVPVEEVGRLLHQLRKWQILAGRGHPDGKAPDGETKEVDELLSLLTLYLDMHDAKFEGGHAPTGAGDFREIFENGADFDRVFRKQVLGEDRRVPLRGLREIMRFGHLGLLQGIFAAHPATSAAVAEFERAEAPDADDVTRIARHQATREEIHARWVGKKKLDASDLRSYVEALGAVTRHRHLAALVMLVDHVRLHGLMMAVLGRLVDFCGLWERDLYFASLALLQEEGRAPDQLFAADSDKFGQGRLLEIFKGDFATSPDAARLRDGLRPHFGEPWDTADEGRRTRNGLAHFIMLQGGQAPDLTEWVNRTRRLMDHDRKLKNAVSKTVTEILARDGLDLRWRMDKGPGGHVLAGATVATRQAMHLGGRARLQRRGCDRPEPIRENLHGGNFVDMAANLFGGCANRRACVSGLDPARVDWHHSGNKGKGGDKSRRSKAPQRRFGRGRSASGGANGRPPNDGGLHPCPLSLVGATSCGRPPNDGGLHPCALSSAVQLSCGRPPNDGGLHLNVRHCRLL